MRETWRWYGPSDPISLNDIRQTGAKGIVTALHDVYDGREWQSSDIQTYKNLITDAGFEWSVVESIPVHSSIKLASSEARTYIDAYKATIKNLTDNGLHTICYNFMPVVDWTRTDLKFSAPNGGYALNFDAVDFAAYDLFILKRKGAENSYSQERRRLAKVRVDSFSDDDITTLENNIIKGLPGSELSHSREDIRHSIAQYDGVDENVLRANLIKFLQEIVPFAQECGARLCIHPDDPPFSLFGLPRVVSKMSDYDAIYSAVPSITNGMTLCTGSLGSRLDNDLPAIARKFASRIHFAHLRNVNRHSDGSFFESDHLDGDVDIVAVLNILLAEERRRINEGRADFDIPMRPDHGHLLLDDINKKTNPGYSTIGRMKGLAELRGVITALNHPLMRA